MINAPATHGAPLATRLRREREARGWSISEFALRSGVSKAMISKIERGGASPTAELLARLANGFGVTLASLFSFPAEQVSPILRRDAQTVWRDPASGYVRRNLTPSGTGSPVEMVEVVFPPHAHVIFDNWRDAGVDQHVWIIAGTLELTIGGTTWQLADGDCLHMRLDQPVTFHNPTDRDVRYVVTLTQLGTRAVGR